MVKLKSVIRKIKIKLCSNEQFIKMLRKEGMTIGKGCNIAKTIVIGDEPYLVSIGDNVRLTHNVQLITHDGSIWTLRKLGLVDKESVLYGRIVIGDNCNIGWNAMILPNVTIGDNCIIAANSVVTKNVPANSVVAGVPARVVENIDVYYKKHKDDLLPTYSMSKSQKIQLIKEHQTDGFGGGISIVLRQFFHRTKRQKDYEIKCIIEVAA